MFIWRDCPWASTKRGDVKLEIIHLGAVHCQKVGAVVSQLVYTFNQGSQCPPPPPGYWPTYVLAELASTVHVLAIVTAGVTGRLKVLDLMEFVLFTHIYILMASRWPQRMLFENSRTNWFHQNHMLLSVGIELAPEGESRSPSGYLQYCMVQSQPFSFRVKL